LSSDPWERAVKDSFLLHHPFPCTHFPKSHYWVPESDIDVLILVETARETFLKRTDAFRDFFLPLPMDVDLKPILGKKPKS
jgi:hypothetical protein